MTDAAEPLYARVTSLLRQQVVSGQVTGQLPAENELCRRFAVSRVTLRRALSNLAAEDLIGSSWGRGWYVKRQTLSEPPDTLMSFTELAERRGFRPSSRILRREERPASLDEADSLRVAPGSPLLLLDRLRMLDGIPTVLQRSLFSYVRLPDLSSVIESLDLSEVSMYRLLSERCGVVAARANYTVEARPADEREATLLEVPRSSPLLQTTQLTFDLQGRPFEQHWSAYPYDRYRFQATLLRPVSP